MKCISCDSECEVIFQGNSLCHEHFTKKLEEIREADKFRSLYQEKMDIVLKKMAGIK